MTMRTAMLVIIAILLAACAVSPPPTRVPLGRYTTLDLQLPPQHVALSQKMQARFRGQVLNLLLQIQNDANGLVIAGLSPTGTRLFTAQFDGSNITSWQSPLFEAPFEARFLLADFLIAELDVQHVQRLLSADNLVEDVQQPPRVRTLYNRNSKAVVEVRYGDKKTIYCHRERGYCLDIETLTREALP